MMFQRWTFVNTSINFRFHNDWRFIDQVNNCQVFMQAATQLFRCLVGWLGRRYTVSHSVSPCYTRACQAQLSQLFGISVIKVGAFRMRGGPGSSPAYSTLTITIVQRSQTAHLIFKYRNDNSYAYFKTKILLRGIPFNF